MKTIVKIRRWTWEFPQSLLGYILTKVYKKYLITSSEYMGQVVNIYRRFPGGISLGYYTLIKNSYSNIDTVVKHESGHGIQSKWLGPLYLITVGLLSGIHNIICRIKRHYNIPYDYYKFFVEKSADKLGGVQR